MVYASSLLLMAGIYLAALASPGPNFFILSQMALDGRHRLARWVVFGLTTGSVTWVVLTLAGLATLLSQHPWLESGVRLLGAAYLVWYGARLLRAAWAPAPRRSADPVRVAAVEGGSLLAAYRTGLFTGLTNPKSAAFWTSAFAAVFPVGAPGWFYPVTVLLVAALSLGWHLGITWIFGSARLRNGYLRIERGVNGVSGGALLALGLHRIVVR